MGIVGVDFVRWDKDARRAGDKEVDGRGKVNLHARDREVVPMHLASHGVIGRHCGREKAWLRVG